MKSKNLNKKKKQIKNIEDKIFDVMEDPSDGNLYLQIDPGDLEQFSAEDLEILNE